MYESISMTAIFIPDVQLEKGKKYTAVLTTGVKDFYGGTMEKIYIWFFTTVKSSATDGKGSCFLSTIAKEKETIQTK